MSKRAELKILPGFNPEPDSTALDAVQFIGGQHVRFYNGRVQTSGGSQLISYSFGNYSFLTGCMRFIINYKKSDTEVYTVIGSDEGLFALLGSKLYCITPLETSSTSIPDSLSTHYLNLVSNPFTTANNSRQIIVNYTSAGDIFVTGNYISITGATDVNGISAASLNTTHYIYSPISNQFSLVMPTAATGTGSGGGTTVIASSDLITVSQPTHGYSIADRIKISGATDTGGILAANINGEKQIQKTTASTYTFTNNLDFATSAVSAGGGTNTVVFSPIADGRCDAALGYGYGMGIYNVGVYNVAKTGYYPNLPRIWSGDLFGTYLILCPGTTGGNIGAPIYQWTGTTDTSPTKIASAPTDANYVFVDNNMIVALCNNTVKWSDQGDQTDWTAAADSFAGTRQLYGAGRLLSRAEVNGENLLFTSSEVYRWRYIGKPFVWLSEKIFGADGISGVHAAVSYNGCIYWMGRRDFYRYNGSSVEALMPTSLREYIFRDVDQGQIIKTHAEVIAKYGEIRWYYQPEVSSIVTEDEPNDTCKVVILSLHDNCWFFDEYNNYSITATDRNKILEFGRAADTNNSIYTTEDGYALIDGGAQLTWSAETNYAQIGNGNETFHIQGLMMDGILENGTATVTVKTKLSPQSSTERTFGPYTITMDSSGALEEVHFRAHGRMRKYIFEGTGFFRMGRCFEVLQKGDGR